jgi:tetratricopeptide (TPR) repeat protein
LANCDSDLLTRTNQGDINFLNYVKASYLVRVGQEQKAVSIYDNLIERMDPMVSQQMLPEAAIAWMRVGERNNCVLNNTGSSCVFPIQKEGVHILQTGSQKAIRIYEQILKLWNQGGFLI